MSKCMIKMYHIILAWREYVVLDSFSMCKTLPHLFLPLNEISASNTYYQFFKLIKNTFNAIPA